MNRFQRPSTHLPEGPPPEVLEEIDAAWGRAQALFEGSFELAFEIDRRAGRVVARGGRPGARGVAYSAVEVLALACGETVESLLDGPAEPRLAA